MKLTVKLRPHSNNSNVRDAEASSQSHMLRTSKDVGGPTSAISGHSAVSTPGAYSSKHHPQQHPQSSGQHVSAGSAVASAAGAVTGNNGPRPTTPEAYKSSANAESQEGPKSSHRQQPPPQLTGALSRQHAKHAINGGIYDHKMVKDHKSWMSWTEHREYAEKHGESDREITTGNASNTDAEDEQQAAARRQHNPDMTIPGQSETSPSHVGEAPGAGAAGQTHGSSAPQQQTSTQSQSQSQPQSSLSNNFANMDMSGFSPVTVKVDGQVAQHVGSFNNGSSTNAGSNGAGVSSSQPTQSQNSSAGGSGENNNRFESDSRRTSQGNNQIDGGKSELTQGQRQKHQALLDDEQQRFQMDFGDSKVDNGGSQNETTKSERKKASQALQNYFNNNSSNTGKILEEPHAFSERQVDPARSMYNAEENPEYHAYLKKTRPSEIQELVEIQKRKGFPAPKQVREFEEQRYAYKHTFSTNKSLCEKHSDGSVSLTHEVNAYRIASFHIDTLEPTRRYDILVYGEPMGDKGRPGADLDQEAKLMSALGELLDNNQNEALNSVSPAEREAYLKEEREHALNNKAEVLAEQPKGRVRTLASDPVDMKMITMSCNQIASVNNKRDMWLRMRDEVEADQVDVILHIGDQIYADHSRAGAIPKDFQNVWMCCLDWLQKEKDPKQWFPKYADKICHLYRQLYRETWTHPPTAYVLSHTSNLMTYDDHDCHDDWGMYDLDHQVGTPEYFIGKCAFRCLCEYQHQLHKDIDFVELDKLIHEDRLTEDHPLNRDHHFHTYGRTGVLITDNRGAQAMHKVEGDRNLFLGTRQWDDIEAALSPGGLFAQCQMLIVNCPVPLVYLPHTLNDTVAKMYDDAYGHWSSENYKHEQMRMLNLLKMWLDRVPSGERQLVLTGGDVHTGGHTEIYLNGKYVSLPLSCSASTTKRRRTLYMAQWSIARTVQHYCGG